MTAPNELRERGTEDHATLMNLAEAMVPIRHRITPARNGFPTSHEAYCPRCGDFARDQVASSVEKWGRLHRIKHLSDVLQLLIKAEDA